MGESILAQPVVEDKMKSSLNNKGAALEVSVSFGRFERDSLSWEKWSTFSPNKYLDEVEKCATPGSVAQKKAYFEAHYKKIAARKMEEIELEKQKEAEFNGYDYHAENLYEYDEQSESKNVPQKSSNIVVDGKNEELGKIEESGLVEEENEVKEAPEKDNIEAHYKKFVACKIEEIEEVKQKEAIFSSKDDQDGEDHVKKIYLYDDQDKNMKTFQNNSNFDESNESSTITIDSQCSLIDEIVDSRRAMIEEMNEEVSKVEESDSVLEESQVTGVQEEIEAPPIHLNVLKEKVESVKKLEKKIGNNLGKGKGKIGLDAPRKSPKMASSAKEKSLTVTKKKLVPLLPKKVPEISTPKTTKPISVSSLSTPRTAPNYLSKTLKPIPSPSMATPHSSTKKTNSSSSFPRSKTVAETKKTTPSSLHMSISINPSNEASPSLPINRSSLIMEKMADKDIVKRAFKSFQKNFNQGEAKASLRPHSSGHNEVSTSSADRKVSSALTPQRGMGREAGKMDVQRAQLGRSLNSTLGGSVKGVSMDQRNAKPAPSSSGVKSDERRKDISKKLVEQSSLKEAERARPGSKFKENEADIKKLRQNLSFKATPMPSFYRGSTSSKLVQ